MAFLHRAEKKSFSPPSTTPASVGPGSYDLIHERNIIPAQAPFETSDPRILATHVAKNFVPGPGYYSHGHEDLAKDGVPRSYPATSPFVSNVTRLHVDKSTAIKVPGPGAYPEGNGWIRKTHRYAAPPTNVKVQFKRINSAPSIPAQHQSYGYEESKEGTLVLQPPAEQRYTGRGRDSVGPGHYNPPDVRTSQGTAFGMSRAARSDTRQPETPGPGAYNPAASAASGAALVAVPINAGSAPQPVSASWAPPPTLSSSFATKVPLSWEKMPQPHEVVPGPGAYEPPARSELRASRSAPQSFGSTARRGYEVNPVKSLHAPTQYRTPGPGNYNVPGGIHVAKSMGADVAAFASTSNRFGSEGSEAPGPGAYRPEDATAVSTSVDRKFASTVRAFGSVSDRFTGPGSARPAGQGGTGAMPGPASYQPPPPPPPAPHSKKGSNFVSKVERFRPGAAPPTAVNYTDSDPEGGVLKGDPTQLGPGAYELPDQWSKGQKVQQAKHVPFGTELNRFGSTGYLGKASAQPGPGQYETHKVDLKKAFQPFYVQPPGGFTSREKRFGSAATPVPGPGQYAGFVEQGSLVKKTFNVTVDPQIAAR